MLKMTWFLRGAHANEWTGEDFDEAVRAFRLDATATVNNLGMDTERNAVFFEQFIDPIGVRLVEEGRAEVTAGNDWSTAIGPIMVSVTTAA
ncbi:hypothetical protein GTW40_14365 [Streptomyces sp. SID4985]|uniref:hypothetical protein n=1 Tax=Streptomyces sp. SID4985 TaxID=2690292 RepID=UPI00136B3987|nr:hypothetical protein [Streptomyces sp. SID4985]MYQ46222.1 hypothetical protein [Streptomyces sp. SID4985]